MSWLARSLAKSLQIDEEFEYDRPSISNDANQNHLQSDQQQEFDPDQQGSNSQTLTGVQGDLSEFTESLSRQIWGVASFLAPAPPPPPPKCSTNTTESDRHLENSGNGDDDDVLNSISEESRFGDGLVVSNSLIEDQEEKDTGYVGVTDEVVVFAMNIAHHPETWLDFPLSEEEDSDDFEMSDTQWNHATLVEHLVPRLAALRIELCPIHMSESYFWKVYFVLLHPRLNKHDADLLSTPQIVAARAMWMKELQTQIKPEPESFDLHAIDSHEDFNTTSSDSPRAANVLERTPHAFEPTVSEKQPVLTKEDNETSDPRVFSTFIVPIEDFGDDEDDWIHENSELDGYDGPEVPIGAEEDISFSDLEDDDYMKKIHDDLK